MTWQVPHVCLNYALPSVESTPIGHRRVLSAQYAHWEQIDEQWAFRHAPHRSRTTHRALSPNRMSKRSVTLSPTAVRSAASKSLDGVVTNWNGRSA